MDKIRDTVLPDHNTRQTPPGPQVVDDVQEREAGEVTSTSSIEERFANWGSD